MCQSAGHWAYSRRWYLAGAGDSQPAAQVLTALRARPRAAAGVGLGEVKSPHPQLSPALAGSRSFVKSFRALHPGQAGLVSVVAMTASSLDHPTFADCAFFYDRSQDRASYSGQSGDQLEGQSWRAGPGGGSGVGVSQRVVDGGRVVVEWGS